MARSSNGRKVDSQSINRSSILLRVARFMNIIRTMVAPSGMTRQHIEMTRKESMDWLERYSWKMGKECLVVDVPGFDNSFLIPGKDNDLWVMDKK